MDWASDLIIWDLVFHLFKKGEGLTRWSSASDSVLQMQGGRG